MTDKKGKSNSRDKDKGKEVDVRGAGGIGQPSGTSGSNGRDGSNGQNGSDGRGGYITVLYDPQVQPYLSVIHTYNPGGPKAAFTEQPIPPLW